MGLVELTKRRKSDKNGAAMTEKHTSSEFDHLHPYLREVISREGLEDLLLSVPDLIRKIEKIDLSRPIVYPASPLGFAESTRPFLAIYTQRLVEIGFPEGNILNPWSLTPEEEVRVAFESEDLNLRMKALKELNQRIGQRNHVALVLCDLATANLDGSAVDDGTSSEIGFAAAKGKPVFGLRTDFRPTGDNLGSIVNLQVEYFIRLSGGKIATTFDEHLAQLQEFLASFRASPLRAL